MDEQPNAEQTRQQAVQEHVQESFADALKTFEGQTEDTGQTPPSEPADNGEAAAPVDKSVETPVQTEAPVEEPKLSTTEYYAKLAELDRQNRILRKQVKDREALPPQEDYAALAKEKPLEVMSKLGLDIDRILEAYAGADQSAPALDDASTVPPAIQAKLEKLEKLEKAVEELSTARTRETEAQQVRREVRQLDAMVTAAEQAAPGKYEYISATKDEGSLNLVLQTAAAIYEKDGEIPKY
ncbi:MAG: hypothetical protein OEU26_10910, partial [Candidatus Tectomicrobia bacterium]|nr:hypothetical protein [Candidatus Tectomicrobia bacterium]